MNTNVLQNFNFNFNFNLKAKWQAAVARGLRWLKRLALVTGLFLAIVTGTVWGTIEMIIPHAHNIYSAAKLVDGEARGESPRGQKAVFATILVRQNDRRFPDTFHGVVYQPYSSTNLVLQYNAMGDEFHENLATSVGQAILRRVTWWYVANKLGIFIAPKEAREAHSYCTPAACAKQDAYFGQLKRVGQIGRHVFYTDCNREETMTTVAAKTNDSAPAKSLIPVPRPATLSQSVDLAEQVDQLIAAVIAEGG